MAATGVGNAAKPSSSSSSSTTQHETKREHKDPAVAVVGLPTASSDMVTIASKFDGCGDLQSFWYRINDRSPGCALVPDTNGIIHLSYANLIVCLYDTVLDAFYVRQSYIALWNEMKAALLGEHQKINAAPNGRLLEPLFKRLILGSSGIGKTVFSWYFMIQFVKMDEFKDWTIIYIDHRGEKHKLTRSPDGDAKKCIVEPIDKYNAVLGNKHIILSDSTDIRDTTNRALVVSSPPTHHWKGFFKSKGVVRYSLPSWTFKELRSACVGLKKDIIEMEKRFLLVGGKARLLFDLSKSIDVLKALILNAIKNAQWELLNRAFGNDAPTLDEQLSVAMADQGFASILLTNVDFLSTEYYRDSLDVQWRYASSYIGREILQQLLLYHNQRMGVHIRSLQHNKATAATAGVIFEQYCIDKVEKGCTLPMRVIRLSKSRKVKATENETEFVVPPNSRCQIWFSPDYTDIVIRPDMDEGEVEIWKPAAPGMPLIDLFIVRKVNGALEFMGINVTVSDTHKFLVEHLNNIIAHLFPITPKKIGKGAKRAKMSLKLIIAWMLPEWKFGRFKLNKWTSWYNAVSFDATQVSRDDVVIEQRVICCPFAMWDETGEKKFDDTIAEEAEEEEEEEEEERKDAYSGGTDDDNDNGDDDDGNNGKKVATKVVDDDGAEKKPRAKMPAKSPSSSSSSSSSSSRTRSSSPAAKKNATSAAVSSSSSTARRR